ncbi:hypothetical protein RvY_12936 [Ramazzottius varieornatus]|uniref:Peptidase M12B domain-containing protein n=1 Tax=Ramazzottius varieornatus TaxID=947166 RepID=A0A1D1VL68_RAMVA|nr:hypothetical protein RvY_12936 [Ramazzottius varieornatus]
MHRPLLSPANCLTSMSFLPAQREICITCPRFFSNSPTSGWSVCNLHFDTLWDFEFFFSCILDMAHSLGFIFLLLRTLLLISAHSLHQQFSSEELMRVFGTTNLNEIPEYQVAFAQLHALRKRSLIPNDNLFYRLNMGGRDVTLHLSPNRRLISPHFVLKPDGLNVNISAAAECLYHGRFLNGTRRAAVSTCGEPGLTGIIETESGGYMHLHPVPSRFQENVADQGHMHILVPKNDTETFCGSESIQQKLKVESEILNKALNSTRSVYRHQRQATPDKLYIETAVFADFMLYKALIGKTFINDHDAFVKYVLAIVNTVQLIYNEPSLGRSVELVLVRLEILQNDNLPFYNEEVDKYLWDFCKWQSNLNPGTDTSTPTHWDHAIILTGFDLRSGNIRSVTGYAPVGGMCNPVYSCTINEGNHFGSAFVIAHEMGHSLTMQHDGQSGASGNSCDAQRYLMSPSTGRGKTTWSSCSQTYLDAFLQSPQSQCLKDVPTGRENALDFSHTSLPGQLYSADDQCRLLYGMEFHRYPLQPDPDVCEILICANTTVYITGHPALPGTFCGEGKWCVSGACSPWGNEGPMAVDGGWSAWTTTASCTSNCLLPGAGLRVFERTCTNPAPVNGGRQCVGKSKRYQKCDDTSLCTAPAILPIKAYANQQCQSTRTTQLDSSLVGVGRQRSQDPTGGCLVWCDTLQGGYKTWGAKFPDGTSCGSNDGASFCIEGQCKAFGCDGWLAEDRPGVPCTSLPTGRKMFHMAFDINQTEVAAQSTASPKTTKALVTTVPMTKIETSARRDSPKPPPKSRFWSPWQETGMCVSSCVSDSIGVRKVVRQCVPSGGICLGRSTAMAHCTPSCPKMLFTADMYATKICTALRTVDSSLTGSGQQLPYSTDDPQQSCKLWCQRESSLQSWPEMFFPDGTSCGEPDGAKRYCLKGDCLLLGCDGKLAHPEDPPVVCTETSHNLVSSGAEDRRKQSHAKLSVVDKPQTGRIPFILSNDTDPSFQWTVVTTPCSVTCGGGSRKNYVQCVATSSLTDKQRRKVDEQLCDASEKPNASLEEACNNQPCPGWSASKWGDCNVDCGKGNMTRFVQCVQVSPSIGSVKVESILKDDACDLSSKPTATQTCVLLPCS